jgi:hypothetical protein
MESLDAQTLKQTYGDVGLFPVLHWDKPEPRLGDIRAKCTVTSTSINTRSVRCCRWDK